MCNNPGTSQQFQEGGPVMATVAGQEFRVGEAGEYQPGLGDTALALSRAQFDLPEQQVAGFTPEQMQAFNIAQQGVGSYQPFLSQASDLTQAGVAALDYGRSSTLGLGEQIPGAVTPGQLTAFQAAQDARDATMQGIGGLSQTGGMYDPSASQPFMNQFEDAAVQQALQDIARQGDIAGQDLRAQAVGSGAFGGSRQAVAEQELQRTVLGEQGRTAANMRQAGFESAAERSQTAFEEAMRRQQAAASGMGQLGVQGAQAAGSLGLQGSQLGLSGIQAGIGAQQQAAGLGQGIAGLGQQMVGLGQAGQQFASNDINSMLGIGGMQQQMTQAQLDAQRANQFQTTMQPFQQLAYASDIIQGLPSGQTTTQMQPGPSIGSQALGLGLGGAALYNAYKPSTPTPAR